MKSVFTGFWPDGDDYADGIITDCTNLVPTVRGYAGAPSGVSAGVATLSNSCLGAALVTKLDTTQRLFAGTQTAVYELSGASWVDRSRTALYATAASGRWRFVQFGDSTVATNAADTLQSSSSGAFADISGAPKATCIDAAEGFVMVGNTSGDSHGTAPDRWKCCAFQDVTDWVESTATQCTTGRLVESPGPILATRRLGANFVHYKAKAIFMGTYVGPPAVWQFTMIPGDIGTSSQESVVNIGPQHIFVGPDDLYTFDGTRPVSIGEGIREWFFRDLNKTYRGNIIGTHDPLNTLVYFFYPSTASAAGVIDSTIAYNYRTNKWGHASYGIEASLEYSTGAITYATLSNYFASYAAISVSYDSPFWSAGSPVLAYIDTSHVLKTLTGDSATSSLTTGLLGDDEAFSTVSRVRPKFLTAPTSATLTNSYTNTAGSAETIDQTSTLTTGKIDFMRSSRWHRFDYDFVGPVEIVGHDVIVAKDGTE